MPKANLEKAISATANRKYEDFADAIKTDVEGKFKDEIGKVVNRTKATMFGGEFEQEELSDEDDNADLENGEEDE